MAKQVLLQATSPTIHYVLTACRGCYVGAVHNTDFKGNGINNTYGVAISDLIMASVFNYNVVLVPGDCVRE